MTDFLAHLREGGPGRRPLAASSAARAIVAVRGFHRFLVLEGETPHDPASAVAPPRPPLRLPKAISIESVEALLAAASVGDTPVSLRDRALLELLYGVGARISEAVGVDVDDLDLGGGANRRRGKGSKGRHVPGGRDAVEAVAAYVVRGRPALAAKGRGGPALFLNQRGARLSRQSAWAILRRAAERAGISEHVSPHTLRHYCASSLYARGMDLKAIQELLGHEWLSTTTRYIHVHAHHIEDAWADANRRVADRLGERKG